MVGDTKRKTANTMCKHSVLLDGHRTSVSLENAFWDELTHISIARNISLNQLITQIDHARQVDQTLNANLSSALRVFVLNVLKNGQIKDPASISG